MAVVVILALGAVALVGMAFSTPVSKSESRGELVEYKRKTIRVLLGLALIAIIISVAGVINSLYTPYAARFFSYLTKIGANATSWIESLSFFVRLIFYALSLFLTAKSISIAARALEKRSELFRSPYNAPVEIEDAEQRKAFEEEAVIRGAELSHGCLPFCLLIIAFWAGTIAYYRSAVLLGLGAVATSTVFALVILTIAVRKPRYFIYLAFLSLMLLLIVKFVDAIVIIGRELSA